MKLIRVAVAAIINTDNQVLIAKRPDHAHQGGLWEFPGGKIETNETLHQALSRELQEEVGITPTALAPLIKVAHHYPDKSVHLEVCKVTEFTGQPHGMEGQPIRWQGIDELDPAVFPAANRAIIDALQLPDAYMITGQWVDSADFSARLENALKGGVKMVQLRLKTAASDGADNELFERGIDLCRRYGARVVLNTGRADYRDDVDGVHLTSAQLQSLTPDDLAPWQSKLIGASCHSHEQLTQALRLGARYISISPVAETCSHPGQPSLGWDRFAELAELAPVPVYALGGMGRADVPMAINQGGQGIAAIGEFWEQAPFPRP